MHFFLSTSHFMVLFCLISCSLKKKEDTKKGLLYMCLALTPSVNLNQSEGSISTLNPDLRAFLGWKDHTLHGHSCCLTCHLIIRRIVGVLVSEVGQKCRNLPFLCFSERFSMYPSAFRGFRLEGVSVNSRQRRDLQC